MPESNQAGPAGYNYLPAIPSGTNMQPGPGAVAPAGGTATGGASAGNAAGGSQTAPAALVATGDLHHGIRSLV